MLYLDLDCTQQIGVPLVLKPEDATVGSDNKIFTITFVPDKVYKGTNSLDFVLIEAYSVTGLTLTLSVGLTTGQVLILLPASGLVIDFRGTTGISLKRAVPLWFKRPSNKTYANLHIYSINQLETATVVELATVTADSFIGGSRLLGLTGLTVDEFVGYAAFFEDVFVGKVVSNTANYVVLDNMDFTAALPGTVKLMSCGTLNFAKDDDGVVGTFKSAITYDLITTDEAIKFWVQDSQIMPVFSRVNPINAIKLLIEEYA